MKTSSVLHCKHEIHNLSICFHWLLQVNILLHTQLTPTNSSLQQLCLAHRKSSFWLISFMHNHADHTVTKLFYCPLHSQMITGHTCADVCLAFTPACLHTHRMHTSISINKHKVRVEDWHYFLCGQRNYGFTLFLPIYPSGQCCLDTQHSFPALCR